jgi:hypothetical protein
MRTDPEASVPASVGGPGPTDPSIDADASRRGEALAASRRPVTATPAAAVTVLSPSQDQIVGRVGEAAESKRLASWTTSRSAWSR